MSLFLFLKEEKWNASYFFFSFYFCGVVKADLCGIDGAGLVYELVFIRWFAIGGLRVVNGRLNERLDVVFPYKKIHVQRVTWFQSDSMKLIYHHHFPSPSHAHSRKIDGMDAFHVLHDVIAPSSNIEIRKNDKQLCVLIELCKYFFPRLSTTATNWRSRWQLWNDEWTPVQVGGMQMQPAGSVTLRVRREAVDAESPYPPHPRHSRRLHPPHPPHPPHLPLRRCWSGWRHSLVAKMEAGMERSFGCHVLAETAAAEMAVPIFVKCHVQLPMAN